MEPTCKVVWSIELPVERTVTECQRKLLKHQENISKQYKRAKWNQNVVVFDKFQEKLIEALASMLFAYQIDTLENEWRNQIV